MSAIAAPAAVRSAAARVSVTSDVLALSALGVLFTVLATTTWGTWGDPTRDSGYDALAGMRVADGELPYRDFTYFYGPLAPAVLGLVSFAGGGLLPSTILGLALAAAAVGGTYLVARLLELLRSESSLKRCAAALSLAWYGEDKSLEPVKQLLSDPDETVRMAAAWAAGALEKAISYRNQFGM